MINTKSDEYFLSDVLRNLYNFEGYRFIAKTASGNYLVSKKEFKKNPGDNYTSWKIEAEHECVTLSNETHTYIKPRKQENFDLSNVTFSDYDRAYSRETAFEKALGFAEETSEQNKSSYPLANVLSMFEDNLYGCVADVLLQNNIINHVNDESLLSTIEYACDKDTYCSVEDFVSFSKDVYFLSFNLKIVGKNEDWWIEAVDVDGYSWLEIRQVPYKKDKRIVTGEDAKGFLRNS